MKPMKIVSSKSINSVAKDNTIRIISGNTNKVLAEKAKAAKEKAA